MMKRARICETGVCWMYVRGRMKWKGQVESVRVRATGRVRKGKVDKGVVREVEKAGSGGGDKATTLGEGVTGGIRVQPTRGQGDDTSVGRHRLADEVSLHLCNVDGNSQLRWGKGVYMYVKNETGGATRPSGAEGRATGARSRH